MRSYIINFILTVAVCSLSAQNRTDSISTTEGSKPVGGSKRIRAIDRPFNVLPQSDSPLRNSFNIQRETIIKPEPIPTEFNSYKDAFVGTGGVADADIDPWGFAPNPRYLNRWFRDITGFRAFLEYAGTIGVGQNANHRIEWNGMFGYQFNPLFYIGVGQGYLLSLNKEMSSAPTFGIFRVNFLDENTTPFLDLKVGYSFFEGKGFYLNPNVGVSFGRKRKAWNISAGYSFQKARFQEKGETMNLNYHGVSLRVSYEFSIF